MRPLVAEIKRNSLDDGPGIRSVIFFKGCPLACSWCHNPECIKPGDELMYRADKCMACGGCVKACDRGAITAASGPSSINREKCDMCLKCVDECPTGALSAIGKYFTPDELAANVAVDKAFFINSGGGVTLSGGEPTLYIDYSAALAEKLVGMGVKVSIETCGDFEWESFEKKLLPLLSLIYVDIKIADPALHEKHTGKSNKRILENIAKLSALASPEHLFRVPLVPDVTSTLANLEAIAALLKRLGEKRVALLPYNPLWLSKAKGVGRNSGYARDSWMSKEERETVKKIFADFEIERDF